MFVITIKNSNFVRDIRDYPYKDKHNMDSVGPIYVVISAKSIFKFYFNKQEVDTNTKSITKSLEHNTKMQIVYALTRDNNDDVMDGISV